MRCELLRCFDGHLGDLNDEIETILAYVCGIQAAGTYPGRGTTLPAGAANGVEVTRKQHRQSDQDLVYNYHDNEGNVYRTDCAQKFKVVVAGLGTIVIPFCAGQSRMNPALIIRSGIGSCGEPFNKDDSPRKIRPKRARFIKRPSFYGSYRGTRGAVRGRSPTPYPARVGKRVLWLFGPAK